MSRTPRQNPDVGYGRPMPWIDLTGGPRVAELEMSRWHPRGACSGSKGWAWFSDGKGLRAKDVLRICEGCPVRRTCLASSLVFAEEYGVWGGIPARSRITLLRRLAAGEPLGQVLDSALAPERAGKVA